MLNRNSEKSSFTYIGLLCSFFLTAVCCFLIVVSAATAEIGSQEISDGIARSQQNLDTVSDEIAQLDQRLATAQQYLGQRRMELADATTKLRNAEDMYNETLNLYEGRISAIYKLGESNYLAVMLSSEDMSDAFARASYLSRISENDGRLVKQVKAQAESIRQMREKVDDLKQSQAEDVKGLIIRRQQIESQISSGKAEIDSQMADLTRAQAREQQQELERAAEESTAVDGGNIYSSLMGPSIIVSSQPPAGLQPTGASISGIASWYGPGFQGNTTANGEIYDMYGYTAAHKSLPFNTWLKVTHEGRSVFVRINDRGPYIGGRIIDLSLASAQAIGISGIGFVSAEVYR
ncbi:MAG: septal ring lytic transglycosylase RlpA family protein [Thermoleophilia bacterium]